MEDRNSLLSDEAIVAECLVDQERFAVLITRYEDKLFRYIKRKSNLRQEEAIDLLQDIFIKVYTHLTSFDQKLSFSSWIYRIAHNEIISSYRKKKVRNHVYLEEGEDEALIHFLSEDPTQEKEYERKETLARITEALEGLDSQSSDIIILRFFEDKSYEEISDILKIPTGTVSTLIHRAKKKLRTHLTDHV